MIHLANDHPVTSGSTRNLRGIAAAHDGRRSAGHILDLKNGNTLLLKLRGHLGYLGFTHIIFADQLNAIGIISIQAGYNRIVIGPITVLSRKPSKLSGTYRSRRRNRLWKQPVALPFLKFQNIAKYAISIK